MHLKYLTNTSNSITEHLLNILNQVNSNWTLLTKLITLLNFMAFGCAGPLVGGILVTCFSLGIKQKSS